MRVLVLGGTRFVGRAVVDAAQASGWATTVFNRGVTGPAPAGVEWIRGDRTVRQDLDSLAGRRWDAAIDTWDGTPTAVQDSARLLDQAVAQYIYVSSRSVYRRPLPTPITEDTPVFDPPFDPAIAGYGELKAEAERAVLSVFGDRALLARAGLILGPHESAGRLIWWLRRMAAGGDVLAPGPPDLPLQYVDVRDLAGWLLDAARRGVHGTFNAVSAPGHTTMAALLEACRDITGSTARLVWVTPEIILSAGVDPWTTLPIWIPQGHPLRALHRTDSRRAAAIGLRCRPAIETVADTWDWLDRQPADQQPAPTGVGLDTTVELAILDGLAGGTLPRRQ